MSAFFQTIKREHPEEGLVVHTDRGSQYTSLRFQALLLRYGCQQSIRQRCHGIILSNSKKKARSGCQL